MAGTLGVNVEKNHGSLDGSSENTQLRLISVDIKLFTSDLEG